MQYLAWRSVGLAARWLPLAWLYALADAVGLLGYYAWPRGRRSMLRNFERVHAGAGWARPRVSPARLARRSLQNYCRYVVDFVQLPGYSPAEVLALCEGQDAFRELDAALAAGRGAVMVCMHFGNWDMAAAVTAARGYPVTVVGESFGDDRITREVFGARERLGMRVVPLEKLGPSIIRTLKRNGLLGLLIDRSVPGEGVKVQFFGAEVEVPAGPAELALRTGAALIPLACVRVRRASPAVRLLVDFSIDTTPSGDHDADVQRLTQAVMRSQEAFIRRYPAQWYKFEEMWNSGASGVG
jgi:phosphatidylinositol dimannoside acyltransferase